MLALLHRLTFVHLASQNRRQRHEKRKGLDVSHRQAVHLVVPYPLLLIVLDRTRLTQNISGLFVKICKPRPKAGNFASFLAQF
jgi:hypothetical protein